MVAWAFDDVSNMSGIARNEVFNSILFVVRPRLKIHFSSGLLLADPTGQTFLALVEAL